MRTFLILSAASLLAAALPSLAYAQNITTFNNRAAFLAATGATNASGALPNDGRVLDVTVNPLGTYSLGSLTLGLTTGSNNVAVGGATVLADWYPPAPGNEIALGFENVQVSTSGPVFSFGFDFIEPDTTVQAWGGAPVESTYELLLFNGEDLVGQVEFSGASIPNDVVTFLGVWSDKTFNRVVINDLTGDDDDEYFGEFYTGTVPARCTLNLGLTHTGGSLTMNFDLGITTPATWNVWITFGTNSMVPLWTLPIAAVTPTVSFPVSFPFPSLGNVGVLTTLTTPAQGVACSAFKTVGTTP